MDAPRSHTLNRVLRKAVPWWGTELDVLSEPVARSVRQAALTGAEFSAAEYLDFQKKVEEGRQLMADKLEHQYDAAVKAATKAVEVECARLDERARALSHAESVFRNKQQIVLAALRDCGHVALANALRRELWPEEQSDG